MAVCAFVRLADPLPARIARELLFDQYQRLKPRAYDAQPVRIVDIDEASLAAIGQWPWPRTDLARVVERLNALGAASIAFDMVFPEADRMSPASIGRRPDVRAAMGADVANTLDGKLPDNDQIFAAALADSNIVLGFGILPGENAFRPARKAGLAFTGLDPARSIAGFAAAIGNIPPLEAEAAGLGAISISPQDNQGIVRQVPLVWSDGQNVYPSLALEALRVAQGAQTILVRSTQEEPAAALSVRVGDFEIPTTRRGDFRVYFSQEVPERYVSIARLLQDPPDEGLKPLIEGNIIFIGTSAVGLLDVRTTPLGQTVPGVTVHAQALEQVLGHTFLLRPDWVDLLEIALIVAMGLTVVLTVIYSGPLIALALGSLLALNVAIGSWFAFASWNLLLDPLFALATGLLLHFALTSFRYLVTDRDKRFVRRAFGRYVSPALLSQIEANPKALRLGGEDRTLTIFFQDVRSFTSLSEKMSPTELIDFLNLLLGQLSEIITDEAGTIDKYIGDSIMAFWNAPVDVPDHPVLACRASLRMRERLQALNEADAFGLMQKHDIAPNVRIGIGLNLGRACVGNMGSEHRFNYSIVGDAVNVAARIESLTKELGVDILAAESLRQAAPDFAWLEAGNVELRGRLETTNLFVLVGDEKLAASEAFAQLSRQHAALMKAAARGEKLEIERRLMACETIAAASFPMLMLFYDKFLERLELDVAA